VFGSEGWAYLGGQTHVAGQSSEERRSRLFGSYIFQPLKGNPVSLDVPQFDVNRAELEAFANACSGGPDYPIPLADMLHCVATTDAIIKSAASGKPENIA
jgi:predicted dehydrogenase